MSAYAFVIGALVGLLVGFGLGIIFERDRGALDAQRRQSVE
jgi:hypothetical protein